MSTATFTKVDYPLNTLITNISQGIIGLPDIQRPFVWTAAQVRDLFDSMYRGFPVGYLLFWQNDSISGTRHFGMVDRQMSAPHLLIVDGQQRLTSLFAVLNGIPVRSLEYEPVNIQIAFRPRDGKFDVSDAAIQRDPEFISDISRVWTVHRTSHRAVSSFLQRLGQTRDITEEDEDHLSAAIDRLFDLQSYSFTALVISSSVNEEQVADIFVRINSKGVQLRQADFILTLLSVFWDEGRSALESFCREAKRPSVDGRASPYNHFIQPAPDQLLRTAIALGFRRARLQHVYSLLRGKDLDTGEFSDERRVQQFNQLKSAQAHVLNLTNWHEFLNAIMTAGFRSNSMITSEMALIYTYALYMIGRHDFGMDNWQLKNLIARWFFMASITQRYSGSPETVMDEDLNGLRNTSHAEEFVSLLNHIIDSELTSDFWNITLPNSLETSAARSPYLFAYYAALVLLDARVLFSRLTVRNLLDPTIRSTHKAIERHHLFPKAYLKQLGYDNVKDINQVANFAFVEWGDNGRISDKSPADYFPEYMARFTQSDILQEMLWFHALPADWYEMDYPQFLIERRKLMAEVTRRGFESLSQ